MKEKLDMYRGHFVYAEPDLDLPPDPMEWEERFGTMYCGHRRYQLGDVQISSYEDFLSQATPEEDPVRAERWLERQCISLPLYLYDHSGLAINTSGFTCLWDSGQIGWIVVEKAKAREALGYKRLSKKRIETIRNILRVEVETYDIYLRGDVWCLVIEDPDGEEVHSLCGIYELPKIYDTEFKTDVHDIIDGR